MTKKQQRKIMNEEEVKWNKPKDIPAFFYFMHNWKCLSSPQLVDQFSAIGQINEANRDQLICVNKIVHQWFFLCIITIWALFLVYIEVFNLLSFGDSNGDTELPFLYTL